MMSFLFSPQKMFGLIGTAVGLYLSAVVWLFVLIAYVTIQQLPFGHADAWRWFVGEPRPIGVVDASAATGGLGLDSGVLEEWFGGHITSGFHDPARPGHNGIDFSLVAGTPIRSTWEGVVVYAGWSDAGYGNLIIVENGDWRTYYGHLSSFDVGVGQAVETGTVVGLSGDTGWSTGPHLHYEIRHQGTPVDAVTLPADE